MRFHFTWVLFAMYKANFCTAFSVICDFLFTACWHLVRAVGAVVWLHYVCCVLMSAFLHNFVTTVFRNAVYFYRNVFLHIFVLVFVWIQCGLCIYWWSNALLYCFCAVRSWNWMFLLKVVCRRAREVGKCDHYFNAFYFYHPPMPMVIHSVTSVCLSCPVCALTFESLHLETSFLLCRYISTIRSGQVRIFTFTPPLR